MLLYSAHIGLFSAHALYYIVWQVHVLPMFTPREQDELVNNNYVLHFRLEILIVSLNLFGICQTISWDHYW
jgi:hypothetical protein